MVRSRSSVRQRAGRPRSLSRSRDDDRHWSSPRSMPSPAIADSISAPPSLMPPSEAGLSWHLIDLVEPTEEYSITQFAARPTARAASRQRAGGVLCFVGGSGLYLRAVIDGLTPPATFSFQ